MAKKGVRSAKRSVYKEFIAEYKQSRSPAPQGFKHKQSILWPILSALVALVISALAFFEQNLGSNITSVYSLIACWAVFGMLLLRYKNISGTLGFVAGGIIGLLVYLAAYIIAELNM